MISYGKQSIDKSDIAAVVKTLTSDWLTQGPAVEAFEKALARYCNARYAVACSNGTTALHLAYIAAGIQKGDEVITTPNTFVATTNMLLAVGAKLVFCDIRPDTNNIDETKIEALITKRTKAIVPVHFAGQPCEMDAIMRIARRHKLIVIEDACHALGGSYKGKKIGSIGDMSMFSFHPVKPITTGEGGAIVTNNKAWAETTRLVRTHGVHKDAKGKNVMTVFGYNYRLTDMQAALGESQMKKLDAFMKKRHQVVSWYTRELAGIEHIVLPVEIKDTYSGWHIYVIKVKNPRERDSLMSYLKKHGVGANFHYPAVYSHPYYRAHGYRKVHLPNADLYDATAITLPLHPGLTQQDIRHIAATMRSFFKT